VDHIEDQSVGPDAEGYRERHDGGEAGIFDEQPGGIAKIVPHSGISF